ncbi:MAG: hypothetical protein GC178_05575 [Flavobacteriales bacterium]|nr:hypothetical protein [Flavobacteriales bacterium]
MKLNFEQGYLRYVVVALLAIIPYMQTAKFDFALDDSIFITKNPRVKNGLKDIPSLFENKETGELQYKTGYRPILLLSYATEVQLFGVDPRAMHRTNIILYAILCLLILKLLSELFPEQRLLMLIVAGIFTVHPLHVEAVANIKGRDEILSMLFGVLFIWLQAKYIHTRKIWMLLLAPLVYLLGVLSKESAITFAGIALGLWIMTSKLPIRQRIYQSISSVAAFAVMILVRLFVYSDSFYENKQQDLQDLGAYHWDGFIGNPLFDVHDFPTLLANAFNIIYQSVKIFLVPYPLVHDYSYNQFPLVDWSSPQAYVGIMIVLLGLVAVFYGVKKRPSVALGSIWFFATISIYLSLVRPATDIFAERFLFTPSLGLVLITVVLISIIPSIQKRTMYLYGFWGLLLVVLTFKRCPAWENTETLMETDVDNLEDCVRANYNYALYLHQNYDNNPRIRNARTQEEVLKYYGRALKNGDRLANLHIAAGNAYMRFGMPEQGAAVFRKAVELFPDFIKPSMQLGSFYFMEHRYDSAVYYFTKATEIGTANSDACLKLALSLYQDGQPEKALEVFEKGEEFASSNVEFYQKYITLCITVNKLMLGEQVTERAYALFPNDPRILDYHQQFEAKREQFKYFRK